MIGSFLCFKDHVAAVLTKKNCRIEGWSKIKGKKPDVLMNGRLRNPEIKLVQQNSGQSNHN